MKSDTISPHSKLSQEYYDSRDADEFYSKIWGGENIHIGMYNSSFRTIKAASENTTRHFLGIVKNRLCPNNLSIADLGSGYGGVSRYLCKNLNSSVSAVNISEVENEKHRALNIKHGLQDKIRVHLADFEKLPLPTDSQDLVWCQDALLHSNNKRAFFEEVSRVLKSQSYLLLADIMKEDDTSDAEIKQIRERIHLDSMGSFQLYLSLAKMNNLELVHWENHTDQLIKHYSEVLSNLRALKESLIPKISLEFMDNMATGLKLWIEGGESRKLKWGIFLFRKISS